MEISAWCLEKPFVLITAAAIFLKVWAHRTVKNQCSEPEKVFSASNWEGLSFGPPPAMGGTEHSGKGELQSLSHLRSLTSRADHCNSTSSFTQNYFHQNLEMQLKKKKNLAKKRQGHVHRQWKISFLILCIYSLVSKEEKKVYFMYIKGKTTIYLKVSYPSHSLDFDPFFTIYWPSYLM